MSNLSDKETASPMVSMQVEKALFGLLLVLVKNVRVLEENHGLGLGLLLVDEICHCLANPAQWVLLATKQLLSNHNLANIRKLKYIGTWKHNSEAVEGTKHNHVIKDSDGSRRDDFSENIQGTTLQATGGDNESAEQYDAKQKQRGDRNEVVEP